LNAAVEARQVLAITGASGSGKSTILADISGVLAPAFTRSGGIVLNDRPLSGLSIEQRNVGILFQDDLLFPHLNVYENLAFALPSALSKSDKQDRVTHALKEADLSGYETRDISTLSGGQRARIALLRTLLSEPELILLDEPFSKLDKKLRHQFRLWVFEHIQELNIPTILVTHDDDDIPANSEIIALGEEDA
jgi:putative thiamine transport system ATP-binding protein